MRARSTAPARLDVVVAEALFSCGFEADVELRMPALEAPVDPIWLEAVLVELVSARLGAGAEDVGVSLRVESQGVEVIVWDDAAPGRLPEVVALLAGKLGAAVSEPRLHDGRTATRLYVPI